MCVCGGRGEGGRGGGGGDNIFVVVVIANWLALRIITIIIISNDGDKRQLDLIDLTSVAMLQSTCRKHV